MAIEEFTIQGKMFTFETRPGVFAQYGLDEGSKLLLKAADFPKTGNILDLGCGCGFLGIVAAGVSPWAKVYLLDSDIRAMHLSEDNARRNQIANVEFCLSDGVAQLAKDSKFDMVISNPPTHQGREVVLQFIHGAKQVLKTGGKAYFVVNRMTSVLDRLKEEFGNSEKVVRREGYIVFRAIRQ